MSQATASNSSGGIGFTGLLTILFVGLKLTGYIGWSWWWVLSPVWISFALAVVFVVIALVGMAVVAMAQSKGRGRSW